MEINGTFLVPFLVPLGLILHFLSIFHGGSAPNAIDALVFPNRSDSSRQQ